MQIQHKANAIYIRNIFTAQTYEKKHFFAYVCIEIKFSLLIFPHMTILTLFVRYILR